MKRLLTILLFLFPIMLPAQQKGQNAIDSLMKELHKTKEDTNKVKLLHEISRSYTFINPDNGVNYGSEELNLAEKLKWEKGVALANGDLGVACSYGKSDFPASLKYYSAALKIYSGLGDKKGIGSIDDNMVYVYMCQSNYPKALEYGFKALKINEELNDRKGIARVSGSIGGVYEYQADHTKALEYYFKALKINEESGIKAFIASNTYNIGLVYLNQKNYPQALAFEMKSLKISEETESKGDIASTMACIGTIYMDQNDFAKALGYDFKALRTLEEMGQKEFMAPDLGNIGICYLGIAEDTLGLIKPDSLIPAGKPANLQKAIEYLNKGIALAKEIDDLNNLQIMSKSLSEAQTLSGNYKGALESYKQFVTTKDSIYNTENNIKITNLETKRALDLKDKQIEIDKLEVIKKRNERGFFMVGVFLLTVIGILFINRQRLQQKKLEAEKKNAESELHTATKLLDNFRQSVQEKNSIIENFTNELSQMKTGAAKELDNETIAKLEKFIILTDEQWEDFRILFEKVHKGFFSRVKEKMPELTPAEIRFVALSKLKLSPKEMASMLGISSNSIRNYRLRLRRKLGLSEDSSIEDLVDNI